MLGDGFQRLQIIFRCRARPRGNRTIVKRFAFIRHHKHRIKFHLGAKAITGRAGAKRIVERKQAGFDFFDRKARNRAGELGGKYRVFTGLGILGKYDAVGQFKGGFKTVCKTGFDTFFDDQAIHDDGNIVFELFVEFRRFVDVIHFAIDFNALKTA